MPRTAPTAKNGPVQHVQSVETTITEGILYVNRSMLSVLNYNPGWQHSSGFISGCLIVGEGTMKAKGSIGKVHHWEFGTSQTQSGEFSKVAANSRITGDLGGCWSNWVSHFSRMEGSWLPTVTGSSDTLTFCVSRFSISLHSTTTPLPSCLC